MRRRVLLTWTLVWAGGALSACGGDSSAAAPAPSAPAPSPPTPAPPAPPSAGAPPAPTPPGPPPPSPSAPGYALSFAAAAIENPLSAGGVWSNNTQGTGGNAPPLNMTSMCVGLAADGITRIAYPTHQGINYDDSFAFVPGFGADQWCEGVLYLAAGYNPTTSAANHEVEIILGCRTATGYHRWNEFMFNWGGGADIVSLDGGPGAYTVIGSITVGTFTAPRDGDVLRATKVADTLNMYLNGVRIVTYTGPLVADGSGIGIAGFIRPGATHNKFGFRSVSMGSL